MEKNNSRTSVVGNILIQPSETLQTILFEAFKYWILKLTIWRRKLPWLPSLAIETFWWLTYGEKFSLRTRRTTLIWSCVSTSWPQSQNRSRSVSLSFRWRIARRRYELVLKRDVRSNRSSTKWLAMDFIQVKSQKCTPVFKDQYLWLVPSLTKQ